MFISVLNLALLSVCYISSNNEIRDSGNLNTATFNQQYGVYYIDFYAEYNLPYLLRYDNNTLLYFGCTSNSSNDVDYYISYSQRSNLSVFATLSDDGFPNFPSNIGDTFDTLVAPSNNQDVYGFSYTYETNTPTDSSPSWTLSIRLLSQTTYDMADDYQEGYDSGYSDGYNSGKQDGTQEGYDNGYTNGYDSGYNTGKTDGYNQGYNVALNTHDFSFTNLFASISDTPILFLRRMFNFGIFGVSAISILFSLFTCLVFIKIIKKFI